MQNIQVIHRFGILAETWKGEPEPTSLNPHFHEELQIVLSEHRLVSYTIKGERITSPIGTTFVIQPGLIHEAEVEKHQPCWGHLRTFLVPRSFFQSYIGDSVDVSNDASNSLIWKDPSLMLLLQRSHSLLGSGEALLAEGALVEALGTLAGRMRGCRRPQPMRCSTAMKRMRDYLGSSLSLPLTLSQIASEVGLSPYHLHREFRRTFGLPPHAYRIQLRVLQGRDLLLAHRPISEIAQRTGFADQAHFTRNFHRIMGVPPSRYQSSKIVQDARQRSPR